MYMMIELHEFFETKTKFNEIYNNPEYFSQHAEIKFYAYCEICGYLKTKEAHDHNHNYKYEAYVDSEIEEKLKMG